MRTLKLKTVLILLGVFSLLIPVAYGLTIDGPTVFQGPGGGNVTFANTLISNQMRTVNSIHLFTSTIFGGTATGSIGFDCDTGDAMSVTNVGVATLTYTISGAGQQQIYFQGYGRPNEITGGTVVTGAGDTVVVTTTGAGVVTLTWLSELNKLTNKVTSYLSLFLVSIIVAAVGLCLSTWNTGTLTRESIIVVASLVVGVFLAMIIWGSLIETLF